VAPLGVGRLVEVDSEKPLDVAEVVRMIMAEDSGL